MPASPRIPELLPVARPPKRHRRTQWQRREEARPSWTRRPRASVLLCLGSVRGGSKELSREVGKAEVWARLWPISASQRLGREEHRCIASKLLDEPMLVRIRALSGRIRADVLSAHSVRLVLVRWIPGGVYSVLTPKWQSLGYGLVVDGDRLTLTAWAGDMWIIARNAMDLEAMVADLRATAS